MLSKKSKAKQKTKAKPPDKPAGHHDLAEWADEAQDWAVANASTSMEVRTHHLTIKCAELLAREIRELGRTIQSVVAGARGA